MPAYNFKKQFADMVESGEKLQTVRKPRKRPTVPGDTLQLYTGMRTKKCKLLAIGKCRAVVNIKIHEEANRYYLYDSDTPNYKGGWPAGRFIKGEGFSSWDEMIEFFRSHYGLPFRGEIIYWDLIKE